MAQSLTERRRTSDVHERVKGLEVTVDEIKSNHLPHIQAAVDKVDAKLDRAVEAINDKIGEIKLGTPPWMTVVFSLLVAAVVYILTTGK